MSGIRHIWGLAGQQAAFDPTQVHLSDHARHWARELGIHPIVAVILIGRGLKTLDEARQFLRPGPHQWHDPYLLGGMAAAVEHLEWAIERGERIWVYGDYDVDGVTATSLLLPFLRRLGAVADGYIPGRLDEGYGINAAAVRQAAEQGVRTIVTVDCGITARAEVELANRLGMAVIITDHHEPPADPALLPPARVLCNPRLPGCGYPNKGLSGAGVAFKLAQALGRRWDERGIEPPPGLASWEEGALRNLDLVALASIADVAPLVGENRALVQAGLAQMGGLQARPGIAALLRSAGRGTGAAPGASGVTADDVAYGLAPRLNAVGRMGRIPPLTVVELLTTADPRRAEELAALLEGENQARREIEAAMLELAAAQCDAAAADPVLVAAGDGWHPGVIGIVASRLLERYRRPVFVVALDEQEGKGSARSRGGWSLPRALAACADLLTRHGGHPQAAGFTLPAANIHAFRERLCDYAYELAAAGEADTTAADLMIEAWLDPADITLELARHLAVLEPFGAGNRRPVFALQGAAVHELRPIGRTGEHLKLRLGREAAAWDAVAFGWAADWPALQGGERFALAFTLEAGTWMGRPRLQLQVRDAAAFADPPGWLEALATPAWTDAVPAGSASSLLTCDLPAGGKSARQLCIWADPSAARAAAEREALTLPPVGTRGASSPRGATRLPWYHRSASGSEDVLQRWLGAGGTLHTAWGGLPQPWADVALGDRWPAAVSVTLQALPPGEQALQAAHALAAGTGLALYGVRGEAVALDPTVTLQAAAAHAPGRDTLAAVYRRLQAVFTSRSTLTLPELCEACPEVSVPTLAAALAIFADLGLARPDGAAWRWMPATRRFSLEESAVYRERQARLQSVERYVRQIQHHLHAEPQSMVSL